MFPHALTPDGNCLERCQTIKSAMPQDVARGYLRPLLAHDWDRASLLNFRAFSIPPAYDYSSLAAPVLLVQASGGR